MLHGYTPADRFLPYLSWTDIDALAAWVRQAGIRDLSVVN